MKVVLDANVLLSAFALGGTCRTVLEACITAHQLFASEFILDEFRRKLIDKFGMRQESADARVLFLRGEATLVQPLHVDGQACRDPGDVPVLGTAVAAGADCLVTGDKDLLTLGEFAGVAILTPRQFLDRLKL